MTLKLDKYLQILNSKNVGSICKLGRAYEKDKSDVNNINIAIELYLEAAKLNDPEAMYSLGYILRKGITKPRDTINAIYWFKKAIEFNHAGAFSQRH